MTPSSYVVHLELDGTALAAAADQAPGAVIPGCPGWDMAALVGHVGAVHRRVGVMVEQRATEPLSPATPPEARDALFAWYREGLSLLVAALKGVDPDEPVWNWASESDRRARFWHRRMSQETAVHRWDAESAAGIASPIDADLAVDGIDEYLSVFVPVWLKRTTVPLLGGSIHLHATDVEGEWWLALHPDHVEQRRQHAKADTAVRGPASDLLLWLWNRRPLDTPELEVFGDRAVAGQFRTITL